MARYRKIDTRIWNDKKFNCLSNDAKFAFIFLLTHQHLTHIGAMRTTLAGLASELHWDLKRFETAFDEIIVVGIAKYDEESSFLWLPNFIKYNRPESPNVVKSWEDLLDYLPECDLKNQLILHITQFVLSMSDSFVEALPEVFRKAMPNQEHEQKQEQNQEQEKEIARGHASAISSSSLSFDKCNKKNSKQNDLHDQAIEILNFLNEKANKAFEPLPENTKEIIERLLQGESVDVCRAVIVKKTRLWLGDKKMDTNLNPVTLFKKENYYRYKGELVLPKEGDLNELK